MALIVALWAALSGCTLGGLASTIPVEDAPHTVVRGEGWAVRVAEGARVTATPRDLSVDAPDGSRWFDVRTVDADPPRPAVALATGWGERQCEPLQWDLPAEPVEGVWTAGGFCTIGSRRYWVLSSVERFDDRVLLTQLVANRDAITYEDLWIDFLGTALTATAVGDPAPLLSPDAVRERLRAARGGVSEAAELPRPGGGTFSRDVSEAMTDVWTRRRTWSPPRQFAPDPTAVAPAPDTPSGPAGETPAGPEGHEAVSD